MSSLTRLAMKPKDKRQGAKKDLSTLKDSIHQDIQNKIFEKFFTTKSAKNGSGLGLSIVSSVIQEHNAEIEMFSNDLVTKFIVKFKK
jgi:nitrogen-specific signal transduction histidine kinase